MTDAERIASELALGLRILRRNLKQLPVEGDVSLPEYAALARLDREGPATSSALARAEQMSPQSMGETISKLERRALVVRAKDPRDGRLVVLSLTDEGREAISRKRATRVRQLARAIEGLDPTEIAQLAVAAPLLERVAQHL